MRVRRFLCKIDSARLYKILRICFAINKGIEINIRPQCEASRSPQSWVITFFKIISLFVFIKADLVCHLLLNFALFHIKAKIEKKTSPKNISEILIYFMKYVYMYNLK